MAKYSLQFQENAMRHQRAHAGALAQTRKPCRRAQSSLQALPAGADRARHSTHRAGVQQPQVCTTAPSTKACHRRRSCRAWLMWVVHRQRVKLLQSAAHTGPTILTNTATDRG